MAVHRCLLCGDEAIARFVLPKGCVARPDDREQCLCLHHALRARPLADMRMVEDYSQGGKFGKHWYDRIK